MAVDGSDARLAFAYAWWLTGDADAAARAVRTAAVDAAVGHLPDGVERLEALLAQVRALAIDAPTMCPASELALLHDAGGLSLDAAANLAAVEAADARTELAHGRLEALNRNVEVEITHPERLGGLAVGNPADVAHARQCTSCAALRALILEGRDELATIADAAVPRNVDELVAVAAAPAAGIRLGAAALRPERDLPKPAPRPTLRAPARPARDVEEVDLSAEVLRREPPVLASPRRAGMLVVLALLAIAAVVAVLVLRGDAILPGEPEGSQEATPTTAPTATATEEDPVVAPPTEPPPTPTALPTATELTITAAGLQLAESGELADENPTIDAFDPLRVGLEYAGVGDEGALLEVVWTVDGAPFRRLDVQLSGLRDDHRFGEPVPLEGWPPGQHQLILEADGEPVATVRFQVVAPPAATANPS